MGGESAPSQQTVTQTNLPEYARPYFERLMARTEASSNGGYVPYGGQRVAGMTGMQQQAMNNTANMQEPGQIRDATNLTNTAAQGVLQNGNYEAGRIGSTYNPQATQMFRSPDQVQSTYQPGKFGAEDAAQYMSPYQQNVTDIAKREATRTHNQQNVARDATAAQRGSFGGSRAALVKQEADRNHAQQLDDIQMKGSSEAFNNAQSQYERDRQAQYAASQQGLTAQQFNSQQQLSYGQAGQANQQFNEGQRMQASQMGMQGQIANEQARAGAAGIQNNSYMQAGQLGGQMGTLGKQQQDMAMQRNDALMTAGTAQQGLNQKAYDTAYDDFVNQRDYDKQNLAFYSGIMRGVPATANSDVKTTGSGGNPLAQAAGLGIAGLGAYNTYNKG